MALQTTSGTCEPVDLWRPCIGWAVAPRSSSCACVESVLILLYISAQQRGMGQRVHPRWGQRPLIYCRRHWIRFDVVIPYLLPVAPHFVVPHNFPHCPRSPQLHQVTPYSYSQLYPAAAPLPSGYRFPALCSSIWLCLSTALLQQGLREASATRAPL
eukprot:EG_transcript_26991